MKKKKIYCQKTNKKHQSANVQILMRVLHCQTLMEMSYNNHCLQLQLQLQLPVIRE